MSSSKTDSTVAPPVVSVLMPVYNGEAFLREAVDSILGQSFADFELIIVNDGSTDATGALLAAISGPRVRVIENARNLGVTGSLNVGLDAVRGRYVARLDADDIAHPERLARQVAFMAANPDVVLLGSGHVVIDADGNPIERVRRPMSDAEFRWTALLYAPVIHPSVMYRAWLVREAGLRYDEHADAEDYDMWLRMLAHGRGARLGQPLVTWRRHAGAIGVARRRQQLATTTRIALANVERQFPALRPYRDKIARLVELHGFGSEQPISWRDAAACLGAVSLLLRSFISGAPRPLTVDDRIAVTRNAALLLFGAVLRKGRLHKRPLLAALFLLRAYRFLPAMLSLAARRLTVAADP